jgi:hypothetical protein
MLSTVWVPIASLCDLIDLAYNYISGEGKSGGSETCQRREVSVRCEVVLAENIN